MTDIIIRNPDDLPADYCMHLVREVIGNGLISTHRGRPCYCLLTTFQATGAPRLESGPQQPYRGYPSEHRVHAHRTDTAHVFRVEVCRND